MLKIGLTGGVGSGKSHIAKAFSILGVPVYNADEKAKQILNRDKNLQKKVEQFLGENIFDEKSVLQKRKLSNIIFNDKQKLKFINNLLHPHVWQDYEKWLALQNDTSYVLKESAILIETELYKKFDAIVLVTSPKELRIKRLLQSGRFNKKNILNIMKNQLPDKTKILYSDYIIVNNEKCLIIPQVLSLHEKFLHEI